MVKVARGKALVAKLAAQPGVRDPEALAAELGRKKKLRQAAKKAKKAAGKALKSGGGKSIGTFLKVGAPDNPSGSNVGAAKDTLKAIDSVHSADGLPSIPVNVTPEVGGYARGAYDPGKTGPMSISLRRTALQPHFTLAHEIGHFLDHNGFGEGESPEIDKWGSGNPGKNLEMIKTMNVLGRSPTIRNLWDKKINPEAHAKTLPNGEKMLPDPTFLDYQLQPIEIFARGYAQWIATRSGNSSLASQLKEAQDEASRRGYSNVWPNEDFKSIAGAFDNLFRSRGWLKE